MRFNLAPLLLLPIAACATPDGEYPSLAIREGERIAGTLEPVAPPPYVPPATPAATLGRLEQLASDAASAHRAFLAEAPRARSAVSAASGDGVGTEDWSVAQVAVAGLEAARSRAMIALADLDRLYVDAALEGAELARIEATRDTVAGQVEEQDATIGGLLRNLAQ